jgi:hypothetical protein
MIAWRNRPIEQLTREEMRLALEDAGDEIVRARTVFGPNQFLLTLLTGMIAGALLTCLVMTLIQIASR